MESLSFMAIQNSLHFKLLSPLFINIFVEWEWDNQFSAQYGGSDTGGPTSYGSLWYRDPAADQKSERGITSRLSTLVL